ncbi:MAG: hypothetical protein DDT36_00998 [Firmicutes bacterium]|nr:hypothetical protein [Bacillota bacterium]
MSLRPLWQESVATATRFSATICASLALAVTVTAWIWYPFGAWSQFDQAMPLALARASLTLLLAIPVFTTVHLYGEGASGHKPFVRWGLVIGASVALFSHYYFLLPNLDDVAMLRYFVVMGLAATGFLVVSHWRRPLWFESYVLRLGLALAGTALYSGVLLAGVLFIYVAIATLFGDRVRGESFATIFAWVACAFSVGHFLRQIPRAGELDSAEAQFCPPLLPNLVDYLVKPLLTIYMAVLYAYFGYILVNWAWPKGVIAHLVLWFALLTVAVLFLSIAYRRAGEGPTKFERLFPMLMLPPLAMLFAALAIRINAFGVTEERYYVGLFAFWAVLALKYLALVRRPLGILLPVSLAALLLISLLGPVGAVAVAEHSQNARLTAMLERQGMLQDGQVRPAEHELTPADKVEISSVVKYFALRERLAGLRYVPPQFAVEDMPQVFGFAMQHGDYAATARWFRLARVGAATQVLPIEGFDYYFSSQGLPKWLSPIGEGIKAGFDLDSRVLHMVVGPSDHLVSIDFTPAILSWLREVPMEQGGIEHLPEDMTIAFAGPGLRGIIVFASLTGHGGAASPEVAALLQLDAADFGVFIDIDN